jgi:hypothetical protein
LPSKLASENRGLIDTVRVPPAELPRRAAQTMDGKHAEIEMAPTGRKVGFALVAAAPTAAASATAAAATSQPDCNATTAALVHGPPVSSTRTNGGFGPV